MRFLGPVLMLYFALASATAHADPMTPQAKRQLLADEFSRVRLGAELHWIPERLGRQIGLGLGWTLPQRWYDADGQLLTERSLLHPGGDLERSGLYLAWRF
jgi:hypothetical protein